MKALPGDSPSRADEARRWFTSTFAGRALLAGASIKLIVAAANAVADPLPAVLEWIDVIGGVSLLIGLIAVGYRMYVGAKRRLLWRVRRKLTLSYIFIGFVPALLIISFFLLCGLLLFFNVSSYLMQSRVAALVDQTRFLAQTAAVELQRMPGSSGIEGPIERRQIGVNVGNERVLHRASGDECRDGSAASGATRTTHCIAWWR